MRVLFAIFRCAFMFSAGAIAATAPSYDFSPLDRYLTLVARNIPTGFEVAIAQNGQLLYWKQFVQGPAGENRVGHQVALRRRDHVANRRRHAVA